MATMKLKIAELRRQKKIGQQELAAFLGVSFQSVSKWETGTTMPDIALLPILSEYFHVSVDELLGLKPLPHQEYIPRNTDNRDSWSTQLDYFKRNRKYFWNNDYFEFLIDKVWKIKEPVDVIDFRCGFGHLGELLLPLLPKGSTYTGIDNDYFVKEASSNFDNEEYLTHFIKSDIYSFLPSQKYDIAICQAALRHMNMPKEAMAKMVDSVKKDGLVICIEVNREFENNGLYIEGMDYEQLCTSFDFHKLWHKELECEGRDYAIGMRTPFYMQQLGLHDIDVRMNDKVFYVDLNDIDYDKKVDDFLVTHGWNKEKSATEFENAIDLFMSRDIDRSKALAYCQKQADITKFFSTPEKKNTFLNILGLIISFGRK